MLVLILASLLSPVCSSQVDTGSSGLKQTCHLQYVDFCIRLKEGDIEAEAGLCVVIPCSFTIPAYLDIKIIWSKCETPNANCPDSDRIFDSEDPSKVVKSGFKGRVSLLEPDVSWQNCGIIINDLRKSDSGRYQLRVEGTHKYLFFEKRVSLSVKDLTQKPTVMVPPLTEGQETTLRCTAPGLCSGSAPQITWTFRGRGLNESTITGNSKTENLSVIEQRHSSTLTFTPSVEHHGNEISCKVNFTNRISTEKTEILSVLYLKDPVITGNRSVKLGDALNLTCSVDSFPPSVVTWTKHGSNQTMQTDTSAVRLLISHMTAGDAGKYICTASQKITNRTARSEVNVTALNWNLLENIIKPEVIVAFLIGLLLSAVVCCSVQKCHRKKQKSSQNLSTENLEMMDVDRAEGGAEPREVEYSDINLDLLKRGRPIGAERSQETSEYAEIKKNKAQRTQDNDDEDGEDGEVMEGNQEEVMVEERRENMVEKEEEEEALYSNVKDL